MPTAPTSTMEAGMGPREQERELLHEAADGLGALMEFWGFKRVVGRIRRAGDRREYFEAETDVWKMISRVLRERELTQIERTLEVFERVREKLRTLPLPGERLRLDDIADRLGG